MAVAFDPYHQWLGIRPEEHPVDHYRLLGIVRFEHDRDVIANACDRLMSHVRTFQTGPRSIYTQEVLTRLASARACLLDVGAKSTYDAVLHGQLAAQANAHAAAAQRAAPMASAYEPATAVMPPPPPPPLAAPPAPSGYATPNFGPPAPHNTGPQPPRANSQVGQEVEYVDKPTPFYLQPWFILLAFAGVLLVGLSAWGLAMILAQGDAPVAQTPDANPLDNGTPTTNVEDDEPAEPLYILQEAGGELNFTAGTAIVEGNPRLVEAGGHSVISDITSVDDRLRWNFRVEKPGPFRIEAAYVAPPGSEGGTFTLAAGEQATKPITVRNTGGEGGSTSERVGFLWVRRAGKHQLVLSPVTIPDGQSLMTLQSLRLIPVGGSGE